MNILYLMQIDWDWIYQRPQILANYLEKDYKCTVVYPRSFFKKENVVRNKKPYISKKVYKFPLEETLNVSKIINIWIRRIVIGKFKKYDAVWVCHPNMYSVIPKKYKGKVIYDCMDNHTAMDIRNTENIKKEENKLCSQSDLILCSSQKLLDRVSGKNKVLVRNGFIADKMYGIKETKIKDQYKIGYIGTVSDWFDFDLIKKNMSKFNNVKYHIIGPCGCKSHIHSRIEYEGTVEHNRLYDVIREYDALIMPFVVNDIILCVDPVKLYEYICFGKCVISVYYPEIERFSPYVYFYTNQEEYDALIAKLSIQGFPPKYDEAQRKEFLEANSWDKRYCDVKTKINELFEI